MTESLSDNQSSVGTILTDNTGATPTLGTKPHHKGGRVGDLDVLPQLPSHKFKYSVWHDLRETSLTGDQLHAPRVRDGPREAKKDFHQLEEEGVAIHHALNGTQRQNYRNKFENWEGAKCINLSYQELSDDFQRANFIRILSRCQSAITVNLVDNQLENLMKVLLPNCEYLNVDRNYLRSFHNLPKTPKVRCITARWNAINTFDGLKRFTGTTLQELSLQGNPVSFTLNYRQTVFATLPQLRLLDGIPHLPNDDIFETVTMENNQSSCILL